MSEKELLIIFWLCLSQEINLQIPVHCTVQIVKSKKKWSSKTVDILKEA